MNKKSKAIIGLTLICLMLFTFVVIQPAQALLPILIGLGVAFAVGAVVGWLYANSVSQAIGVDEGAYMLNVAENWQADYNNTNSQAYNIANILNNTLSWVWARQAEYTAMNYLNETEFPYYTVLEESAILDDYFNISAAQVLGIDHLIQNLNNFTTGALTNLTLTSTFYNFSTLVNAEGHDYLQPAWLMTTTTAPDTGNNTLGMFFYDETTTNALTAGSNFWTYLSRNSAGSSTVKYHIEDINGTLIFTDTISMATTSASYHQYETADLNLQDKQIYKLKAEVTSGTGTGAVISFNLPLSFYPINYTYTSAAFMEANDINTLNGVVSKAGNGTSQTIHTALGINFYNSTTSNNLLKAINLAEGLEHFNTLANTLAYGETLAMNSANTYWQTLKAQGFNSSAQIPANQTIPPPSVAGFSTGVTEALTYQQLQALYYGYLNALANYFNSTTYKTANFTLTDIPLSDLTLVVNATIYSIDGNTALAEKQLCMLMPTISSFTLYRNVNNTLNQQCNAVAFSGIENSTVNYYSLPKNTKVFVHQFIVNGTATSQNSAAVTYRTLDQIANAYDFETTGTEVIITPNTMLAMMIPLIIIMVVMGSVTALNKKKRNRD